MSVCVCVYVCQSACILSSWPKLSSRYYCRSGICVAFDLFGVILYIWFSTPECPCVKQHSIYVTFQPHLSVPFAPLLCLFLSLPVYALLSIHTHILRDLCMSSLNSFGF